MRSIERDGTHFGTSKVGLSKGILVRNNQITNNGQQPRSATTKQFNDTKQVNETTN